MLKNFESVIFDLDGTIVESTNYVNEETYVLLDYLKFKVKLFIATGRSLPRIQNSNLDKLYKYFEPEIVCYNGNALYDLESKKLEVLNSLPFESFKEFYQIFSNYAYFIIDDGGEIFTNHRNGSINAALYFGLKRSKINIVDFSNFKFKQILSIILIPRNKTEEIVDMLNTFNYPNSCIEIWHTKHIKIIPENTLKIQGVNYVLQKYNIKFENAISIGNDLNDISLFNHSAISIAVKNSNPELIKLSSYYLEEKLTKTNFVKLLDMVETVK